MLKYLVSDLTATGDATKTLIGTITLPASTKAIVGAWGYASAGAIYDDADSLSGILELESPDCNIAPCQLPLEQMTSVGTAVGITAQQTKVWPLNVPAKGAARISGYMTMDMAITAALKGRFGLVIDVAE
jgi:hypothetical protein